MTALWVGWCIMAWIVLHAWLIVGAVGLFAIARFLWRNVL